MPPHQLRFYLLVFLGLVLLASPIMAEDVLKPNTSVNIGELEVLMRNWDLAKSKKIVFVHFVVRNRGKMDQRCDWRDLAWLVKADGELMASNYDALVDSGTGFVRATGPVVIPKGGRRVKISVPFLIGKTDLPARIQTSNGRRSPKFPD